MPQWVGDIFGADIAFWISYLLNGRHLAWYASVQFTLGAAVMGALFAMVFGFVGATARGARLFPVRLLGSAYINIVRGVPDVLFFLFVPLAFEQTVEFFLARARCSPEALAAAGSGPACPAANLLFSTGEYLLLASVSLGLVYGAFVANVVFGAMNAVAPGQLEAARAFGFSPSQLRWRIQIRQMWVYALPGLSNCWLLLIKSTALLSLLQIADIVQWAQRLGSPNFLPSVGLVHEDWRWRYYLVLLLFYILLTLVSEKVFGALTRWAGRGMITAGAR